MKEWVKLDNASNIFLAARSDLDTKVFRLTATMKEDIDPYVLQKALDRTLEKFHTITKFLNFIIHFISLLCLL